MIGSPENFIQTMKATQPSTLLELERSCCGYAATVATSGGNEAEIVLSEERGEVAPYAQIMASNHMNQQSFTSCRGPNGEKLEFRTATVSNLE